jgi:hypothetical protein
MRTTSATRPRSLARAFTRSTVLVSCDQLAGSAWLAWLHHSGAHAEAEEGGLLDALELFPEERSLVADVLTYCDLTTASDGSAISAPERLFDVATRYGDDHPVGRAVRRSREELLTLVNRVAALEGDRATAEGRGRGRVRARRGGAAA